MACIAAVLRLLPLLPVAFAVNDELVLVQRSLMSASAGLQPTEPAQQPAQPRERLEWPGARWVAGVYGSCTTFCNTSSYPNPIQTRSADCKSIEDGTKLPDMSCHAPLKPKQFLNCSCTLMNCTNEPVDCGLLTVNQHPIPLVTSPEDFGCFEYEDEPPITTCNQSSIRDLACMNWHWNASGLCRSGLPFYRDCNATTLETCADFCFTRGMDIFGIITGSECRCGASILNTNIWEQGIPRRGMMFDHLVMNKVPNLCPIRIGRYKGHYEKGGLPSFIMRALSVDQEAYTDSIVTGNHWTPEAEEDLPSLPNNGALTAARGQDPTGWDRLCWPSNCGPGNGPWPDRQSTAPTGVAQLFQEYVIIPYRFEAGLDDMRKDTFRQAIAAWHQSTCIVLEEAEFTTAGINVGFFDDQSCFLSGIGHGLSQLNLGWCNSAYHLGNVIHEIGKALGMDHEQKRPDATMTYRGHGPYITVHWEHVPVGWMPQYLPDESTYTGSADDGPGDPHVGYADYDFASIMHYPATTKFSTIPESMKSIPGQRSALSPGDISQALDMYQCRYIGQPPVTTPSPVAGFTMSGSCITQLNGDYLEEGITVSGASWYSGPNGANIFFDPSCNGGTATPRWILTTSVPNPLAERDLDGDQTCMFFAFYDTTSPDTPFGTNNWVMYNPATGSWEMVEVTLDGYSTFTTTVYTGPTTTSTTVTTTTSTITTTTTTFTTAPGPAGFTVSGSCSANSIINGEFTLVGHTATGAPYYGRGSEPYSYYMWYDPSCNGGGFPAMWIFTSNPPSIAAASDLDGDGTCSFGAYFLSSSLTPPMGTSEWYVVCSFGFEATQLTLAPDVTSTTAPATSTTTVAPTTTTIATTTTTIATTTTTITTTTTTIATTTTTITTTTTTIATTTTTIATTTTTIATTTTTIATTTTTIATTTTTIATTTTTIAPTTTTIAPTTTTIAPTTTTITPTTTTIATTTTTIATTTTIIATTTTTTTTPATTTPQRREMAPTTTTTTTATTTTTTTVITTTTTTGVLEIYFEPEGWPMQHFIAEGTTASGAVYFHEVIDTLQAKSAQDVPSLYYMFWDPSCDGKTELARWIVTETKPDTSKLFDLDNDGICRYYGFALSDDKTAPPPNDRWHMNCYHPSGCQIVPVSVRVAPRILTTTTRLWENAFPAWGWSVISVSIVSSLIVLVTMALV